MEDAGPRTRGFLFSDLRGYTEFVESHGDRAGARLLDGYRSLVRGEIVRFGGAEIKTEGDSFYVVFGSASEAVEAGLAIATAAVEATALQPDLPIAVGIGIHAGESVRGAEGYVGSAVNIAARVCGVARSGEVLVTETVRSLTRTGLDARFRPRGRHRLKGIDEPIQLYAVDRATETSPARAASTVTMSLGRQRVPRSAGIAVLAVAGIVAIAAAGLAIGQAGPTDRAGVAGTTAGTRTTQASPTATRSPRATPTLNARDSQVLPFVPPRYRANCRPGNAVVGRGRVICRAPSIDAEVMYTLYDNAAGMDAAFYPPPIDPSKGVPFAPRQCDITYSRPRYYGGGQQTGRLRCELTPAGGLLVWTDNEAAVITETVVTELTLERLRQWWDTGEAGPYLPR